MKATWLFLEWMNPRTSKSSTLTKLSSRSTGLSSSTQSLRALRKLTLLNTRLLLTLAPLSLSDPRKLLLLWSKVFQWVLIAQISTLFLKSASQLTELTILYLPKTTCFRYQQ
jgi:hypothetical protein